MAYEEIIAKAIEFEKKARDHYKDLAEKSIEKYSRETLERLSAEEEEHVRIIEEFQAAQEKDLKELKLPDSLSQDEGWKKFENAVDELKSSIFSHSDELSVILKAVELEDKGYHFYKKAYEEAEEEFGKNFFQFLMEEEIRHKRILQKMYDKLCSIYDEDPHARPQL